jgi:hypothetical protein
MFARIIESDMLNTGGDCRKERSESQDTHEYGRCDRCMGRDDVQR